MDRTIMNRRFIIPIGRKYAFEYLVMVALCQYSLFDFFRVIISRIPYIGLLSYALFPTIYLILILLSYNQERVKWVRPSDWFIIVFFALAIVFSILIYPQNMEYISMRLSTTILPCIPFFFLGLCLTLDEGSFLRLSNVCCVAIVVSFAYTFLFMSRENLSSDEMSAAYTLLPNVLIVITSSFFFGKWYYKAMGVLGFVYILLMGTRGPVVILFVYTVVCIWERSKARTSLKIFFSIVLLSFSIAFIQTGMYLNILLYIKNIIRSFGLTTRVIDYLITGNLIKESSGRDMIYQTLMHKLAERPIWGYGIYGEWQFVNWSAHNIYLETIFQFGIPLGGILIIAYISQVIASLRKCINPVAKQWIIMWSCLVFIRGIFGGALLSYYVFFLLGFCLKESREAKYYNMGNRVVL